jgi:hypothetical protein
MKHIYPAGPFSWQERILAHTKELENLGYINEGEWLHQEQQFTRSDNTTVIAPGLHSHCQELSERDVANIVVSDTLILFEPGVPLERNTRVAEFGMALGLGKQCIVIGPEENDKKDVISSIFVHLRDVSAFQYGGEWHKKLKDTDAAILRRIKPVIHYQLWTQFMADILNPERVECCAGCGTEYRVRDCGCPCGSYFIYKTRKTNFSVLLPPKNVLQSAALASV